MVIVVMVTGAAEMGSIYEACLLLPVAQILLNGGSQLIFQSAMRATAKLNLLSPTVFPLPFGAKLPPVPLLPPGKRGAKAEAAAKPDHDVHAASIAGNSKSKVQGAGTKQAKHAQHGQDDPNLPDPLLQDMMGSGVPSSMQSSNPEQGVGEPGSVSISAGGRRGKSTVGALKAHGSHDTVGPVVTLVESSKGLVAASRDESEMQPQFPGMGQMHNGECTRPKAAILGLVHDK